MIKVMIIEDDPMVREINSKFIDKVEDFTMCGATGDIIEAKELLMKCKPQLLLLDIFLPKGNGLEFLKWLRREEVKCDVILITADRTIEAVQEAFRYGAMDYLIKPFTFQRFREALLQYKTRYESLNSHKNLPQKEIDKYTLKAPNKKILPKEEEGDLTKGLNVHTYNQIWDYLISSNLEVFSAEEIAEKLGMARVTVRRYLEYMYKESKLDVELVYGKIGRPSHMYKINSKDQKDQKE